MTRVARYHNAYGPHGTWEGAREKAPAAICREAIAGIELKATYDLTAPKGVNGRNSDNTKIREYLGWEPSVALRDGLEKTYRWIYDDFVAKYGD